jgi:peptidyl-prolyl cis-trans isomerase C
MNRFHLFDIACVLIFVVAFLAPSAALAEKATAEKVPANAAIVNGKSIAYGDFQREMQLYQRRKQSQGIQEQATAGQDNNAVINDMINRELMYQESVKKKMKVEPETIQEEFSAIQRQFPDQQQFEGWLASLNLTEKKLKEEISQRQGIRNLIEAEIAPKVKITESEARVFYTSNPNLFQRPEEVHAQHILIKVENEADERKKADARKKIQGLKKRLDSGEEFSAIAKSQSDCPSAQNNGDLGFFSRGRMVPAFENAAFELKPGQISQVVETQFGFHLIKVLEHRPAVSLKFEEVQDRISDELSNRQIYAEVLKYVEHLRKSAKIETFIQ